MRAALILTPLMLAAFAPALAHSQLDNPDIDYPGFAALVGEVADYRTARLLEWDRFIAEARRGDAILLDTRSAQAFAAGHIAGAVNLPLSDFTDAKLAKVIGASNRPIYIYCNNNFTDGVEPVATKSAPLALNIPTFINLYGYGYQEVYELGGQVAIADLAQIWVNAGD